MILGSNCNSIVGCLLLWASAVVAAHWITDRLDSTRRPMVNNLNLGFALVCKARKSNWTNILTYGCPWYNLKWDTLIDYDLHILRKKAMSMSRDNFPEIYLAQIWTSIHSHLVWLLAMIYLNIHSRYVLGIQTYYHWYRFLVETSTRRTNLVVSIHESCSNDIICASCQADLLLTRDFGTECINIGAPRMWFIALGRLVDPLVAGWTGGIVVWQEIKILVSRSTV